MIQLNDEQYWLYAGVDPTTNRLLHARLYSTRTTAVISMFLSELRDKHRVDGSVFLVDGSPWLQATCHSHGLRFQHGIHGNRDNVERVFREVKRRTNQFSNCFSHATAETVKNWLRALVFAWNQLI